MLKKIKSKQDLMLFLDFISKETDINKYSFRCKKGHEGFDEDGKYFYHCDLIFKKKFEDSSDGRYICGCNFSKKIKSKSNEHIHTNVI